jgi:hypothetical protein
MDSRDVRAMISGLIEQDRSRNTERNYRTSWAEASGGSPDEAPVMIINPPREFFVQVALGRGYIFGWTTEKDRQGVWWSFRSFQPGHLCGLTFDEWQPHKQRQGAKAAARAAASLERRRLKKKTG